MLSKPKSNAIWQRSNAPFFSLHNNAVDDFIHGVVRRMKLAMSYLMASKAPLKK